MQRRQVLTLPFIAAAGLAACSADPRPGGDHATSSSSRSISTRLGEVETYGAISGEWQRLLPAAASSVAEVWGVPKASLRITFCDSDEEFESAASGLSDVTAAVTTKDGIFVGPSVERTLTPQGRQVVLAHELTHAVLGHFGTDHTAMWVKEGAAEWTATRGVTLSPRQLWPTLAGLEPSAYPRQPPTQAEFASKTSLAYETSASYATFLVSASGASKYENFVRRRPSETEALTMAHPLVPKGQDFVVWLERKLHPDDSP